MCFSYRALTQHIALCFKHEPLHTHHWDNLLFLHSESQQTMQEKKRKRSILHKESLSSLSLRYPRITYIKHLCAWYKNHICAQYVQGGLCFSVKTGSAMPPRSYSQEPKLWPFWEKEKFVTLRNMKEDRGSLIHLLKEEMRTGELHFCKWESLSHWHTVAL